MEFEKRLEQAIARGQHTRSEAARADAERALSAEESRRLHSQFQLELSEHIEACLKRMPEHFPGFRFESLVGERGWGATVTRDDVGRSPGALRQSLFSRLEMTIRPFGSYHVLELSAKGTIHNKEIYNRNHFQRLAEVDLQSFREMIDLWILEYAELYAARS